jgi:tRNA (guanine-N(7)-)-methyltransferase
MKDQDEACGFTDSVQEGLIDTLPEKTLTKWLKDYIPIEIDIGSAHGEFLNRIGSLEPEKRFIGVEIEREMCLRSIQRSQKGSLKNVRTLNMEAYSLLLHHIPANSISVMHVYFPSPYDQIKERRLITPAFLKEVHRALETFGSMRLLTDSKNYFDHIAASLDPDMWWPVEWSPVSVGQADGYLVGTPLEIKYRFDPTATIYDMQILKYCMMSKPART